MYHLQDNISPIQSSAFFSNILGAFPVMKTSVLNVCVYFPLNCRDKIMLSHTALLKGKLRHINFFFKVYLSKKKSVHISQISRSSEELYKMKHFYSQKGAGTRMLKQKKQIGCCKVIIL